jgi:hypothetical protein
VVQERCIHCLLRRPEGKNHLKDRGVDGRILLKCILEEVELGGMDLVDLARLAGCCECSNEPSSSIKCGGFLRT